MKILRAVKTNKMTQGFKANPNMVAFYYSLGMTNHGGYDFSCYTSEPIYFDYDGYGKVLNTEVDNAGGLGVNIITDDANGIYKHRYWHLKSFNVIAGQDVKLGDIIGYADNTGLSTNTHLHRDIKEMSKINGVYKVRYPNNGTYGTIEYENVDMFVLDYLWQLNDIEAKIKVVKAKVAAIINLFFK